VRLRGAEPNQYDPFGNLTVDEYMNADEFPYRFSTKPQDLVTGLYYYGYRYYDPLTGRWPSRDPIGERGGVNLYGFVGNSAASYCDKNGQYTLVNKNLGASEFARFERLLKQLEKSLADNISDIDFIAKCIAGEILEGNCDNLDYGRRLMGIGPGLSNLLSAKRKLQNVFDGLKGGAKLDIFQQDVGSESYARNGRRLTNLVSNDFLILNTNSTPPKPADWRKASDSRVMIDILHELNHEENPDSNDTGNTSRNSHLIQDFACGDVCKSSTLGLWIHPIPRRKCCDELEKHRRTPTK
jgi:RHS repeat-associated protein